MEDLIRQTIKPMKYEVELRPTDHAGPAFGPPIEVVIIASFQCGQEINFKDLNRVVTVPNCSLHKAPSADVVKTMAEQCAARKPMLTMMGALAIPGQPRNEDLMVVAWLHADGCWEADPTASTLKCTMPYQNADLYLCLASRNQGKIPDHLLEKALELAAQTAQTLP